MLMKSYIEATRDALAEELAANDTVVIFGRDIGPSGGTYRSTSGLQDVFGTARVREFPPGDNAIIGAAIGAAVSGLRPVVDLTPTQDISSGLAHLVQAAATEHLSDGDITVPVTIRALTGYGLGMGCDQSGDLHALWASTPGIDVVAPTSASGGKGLLKAAIRSNRPTVLLEDRSLFELRQECEADDDTAIPLTSAETIREGDVATLVAWGAAVGWVETAASRLSEDGHRLEVIDLRSLSSLDIERIGESCAKTGRVFIVEPTLANCSIGADLASRLQEVCFDHLDAPIGRLNVSEFVGYAPTLEASGIPTADDVVQAISSWL